MAINLYSKASVDSLLSPKLSISSLTNAAATTLNATAPTTNQVLSYDGTELKWATVSGGGGAAWGGITGTLSSQTDLQNALDLKAPLASPTFTGTVTIPAGASISGYLTTSTASSTYLAKASNLSDLANTGTARTNLGLGGLAVLNDAPSDGSQYARQSGAWAVVTGGGGGGGGVVVNTYGSSSTSGSFTWTKPAGAKVVDVYLFGGGAGGGSGARYATSSGRSGGGGGSGGTILQARINAAFLGATETVVVGAGGAGGATRTTDTTNGLSGSVGGVTTFSIFQAGFGSGGGGGQTTAGNQGLPQASCLFGIYGGPTSTNSGAQGRTTTGGNANSQIAVFALGLGGGGGGGAAAASVVNANGGNGGGIVGGAGQGSGLNISIAGGFGGVGSTSTQATAGTSITTQYFLGTTGGGGGFYRTGAAGGTGGAGGWPGGGGGGGGASDNGFNSGAGGSGANGYVVIITYT